METINLCDNTDFPNKVGKDSRILGIDPGKKNIGISISDPDQKIAIPADAVIKCIARARFEGRRRRGRGRGGVRAAPLADGQSGGRSISTLVRRSLCVDHGLNLRNFIYSCIKRIIISRHI